MSRSGAGRGEPFDVLAELTEQPRLGLETDDALNRLTVLEEQQGWNAAHAKLARHRGVRVDVDLGDGQNTLGLVGNLLEHRCDHLARPAPGRPEVDQHRGGRLEHLRLELSVSDRDWMSHFALPLSVDNGRSSTLSSTF